jgi:cytochrome b561
MVKDPLQSSQPVAPAARYGKTAITFHWAVFVLVVVVGTLGLLHDDWPRRTMSYWINIHALLGLLLWIVLIFRFSWRISHAPPSLPTNVGPLARRFSSPVHFAMYALLFVIPVIGVVTFIYHGRIFDFGVFHLDFGIKKNRAIFEPTEDIHGYLAYGLFGLAGLHAAAALWHQFYLRDGVLRRMWPHKRHFH